VADSPRAAQVVESLAAVEASCVDWCLVECVLGACAFATHHYALSQRLSDALALPCACAALELHARGQLCAVFPLVVGAECDGPDGRPARDRLFANAAYKAARARLPRAAPTATLAVADGLLRTRLVRGTLLRQARAAVR
jgi:hypothetical protein